MLFDGTRLGRYRRGDVLFEALRLNGLHRHRDVLLEVGLCGRRLLLDEKRRLRGRLLAGHFVSSRLGARFVRSRLLLPALLRPLLRPLIRLAIAIALAMTIAPAAPLLFSLLGRLLARIGEAAFRALLPRRLLRLLRSRGPLLLLPFATGAGTIPLRAARFLTRPAIAAAVASAMTLTITIGAAATTVVALARALFACCGLRA